MRAGESKPGAPAPVGKAQDGVDDPSVVDAKAVAAACQTDLQLGLTAAEAARRLARDGANELRAVPQVAGWRRALAQLQDPLVYLLLVAVAVALAAWAVEGREGWPVDAIVIAVVVLLNAVLGCVQEAKAQNAVAALARMTQASASVMRDGQLLRIPSAALVRGDLLVLGEGDAVGADARLAEAADLRVLEASLTGESEAVLKDAATLPAPAALGDRLNMVFKGTAVAQGSGRAVVTATGMQPSGRDRRHARRHRGGADAAAEGGGPHRPHARHRGRRHRRGGGGDDPGHRPTSARRPMSSRVLLLGVSLAVAAVPEGLPAILSVVLALGVQRMARRNAIVKKLSSVETLGSASVICTDKTGTLTRSEMTIERVMTASGSSRRHRRRLRARGPGRARRRARCSRARCTPSTSSCSAAAAWPATPTCARPRAATGRSRATRPRRPSWWPSTSSGDTARREQRFERIGEIPFTSERKMMSTIERDHEHGDAPVVISKGAPDVLLDRCTRVRVGTDVVALDDAPRAQRILADVEAPVRRRAAHAGGGLPAAGRRAKDPLAMPSAGAAT